MSANAWINHISFKNGLQLPLEENSIVVFVGPNNSGKSSTLHEIHHDMTKGAHGRPLVHNIIEQVNISYTGSGEDFLTRIAKRKKNSQYYYQLGPNDIRALSGDQLKLAWENAVNSTNGGNIASLPSIMSKNMDTVERLMLVNPPETIDFIEQPARHPIHVLKEHDSIANDFSKYFKLAFGTDVVLNHGAGKNIPLHVGKPPVSTVEFDRISSEYQSKLRKLPFLHMQGDGMKSFAGVFMGLFAEDYSINLIDEPEAFLHPPQAALLGKMIAKELGDLKQVFIATHSEHFLKGILDNSNNRLVIVRIQRTEESNKINVLTNLEIKNIWQDSLLRHSNILDSLFHKKVVLGESDSDLRFYSAMATAIIDDQKIQAQDILFVQSGGKHRFPVVVRALKALEVPTIIIGDFDLYHEENPLKPIYEELGGNWDDIKLNFNIVRKSIDQKRPDLQADEVKQEIERIFSSNNSLNISDVSVKAIKNVLKKSSPWAQAKSTGKGYLPSGDAINAFNDVQAKLKEKGIVVLEVGEIEAFDKTVGGHGPQWVNKVLEKDLITNPDLEEARKFTIENILRLI